VASEHFKIFYFQKNRPRTRNTAFSEFIFIKPRLVFMPCCYEKHLSKEFCGTRSSTPQTCRNLLNKLLSEIVTVNCKLATKPLFVIYLHENETGLDKKIFGNAVPI